MSTDAAPKPFYTVRDLSGCLRVGARQIRKLLKQGRLPTPSRIGRRLCWPAPAFDAWLAAGGSKGHAERGTSAPAPAG